jgi:hypothetical protein
MWVVRDGDDLYVRSMYGRAGAWFRGTQTRRQGHISSGRVEKDVTFVIDTDPALNDRIDAAYRDKYRRVRGPHRRRCPQPSVTRLNDQARTALTTSPPSGSGWGTGGTSLKAACRF